MGIAIFTKLSPCNRIWQDSRNTIRWPVDVYIDKENEATYKIYYIIIFNSANLFM